MEAETAWDWHNLHMLGWEPVHHWCHITTSRCRPLRQLMGSSRDRWGLHRLFQGWCISGFYMWIQWWNKVCGTQICKLWVPVWRMLWVGWDWHDDFQSRDPFLSHQSNSGEHKGRVGGGVLCRASFGKHWLIWLLHQEFGIPFSRAEDFLLQPKRSEVMTTDPSFRSMTASAATPIMSH